MTVAVDLLSPFGGSVSPSGPTHIAGDTETEELGVSLSPVTVHQDCVAVDEETGLEFTLNGQPNEHCTLHLEHLS